MSIRGFQREVATEPLILDPSQAAVVMLADTESAAVLGAPGSGKTTTICELVADRILGRGWSPDELVVLTPTRATASRLRDSLALRVGAPTSGPLARTVNSLAFEIVGNAARAAGAEPPRLVTGGDQDADIAQLIAGHLDESRGPDWPEPLGPVVRGLRGFRTELRDLMMRATEYGLTPEALGELGRQHDRTEWVAAASFIQDYLAVVSSSRPNQVDAAELAQYAAAAITRGDAGERIARLHLVVLDDLQEATESTFAILRALAGRGIAVVAFGDPDVAANAFRGGEPDALGRLASVLRVPRVSTLTLRSVHRQGMALRQLTSAITGRIGTAAAGTQRTAVAAAANAQHPVRQLVAVTPARQLAAIARELRERHLAHGVPWHDMAVIVRSGTQVPAIRRALALAEVPAVTLVGGTALRDDRAARALLTLVGVGTRHSPLSAPAAVELLAGPFGGLDRLAVRRLRLALRAEEIAGGGSRSSDELLVEALATPGRFATIDHRVGRRADRLAQLLDDLRMLASEGASVEELLWLAWDRGGLARTWFDQALGTGIAATEANLNLDGIVALFTAAKRFAERQPGTAASVFLSAVLDAEVAEDSLSPQRSDSAVLVTTPSGALGREFDTVVVAGLQDGAWPNRRLRGSLLGAPDLVRVVSGLDRSIIDERKLVLDDELRMFALAVSRARAQVVLAAVANDDEAASPFLALVSPDTPAVNANARAPLSLRGLTGVLRRELVDSTRSPTEKRDAASALARLAAERVPGADPAQWHGLIEASTSEPLYPADQRVPVSPSKLERFEESPLDWFVESIAGSQPSEAMGIGTIMHWAMETATDPDVDAVWAAAESRWNELVFEAPWMAESQRRAARLLAGGIAEYLADFQRGGKTLVAAEGRFTIDIGRAEVRGSIDRVERARDGSVVIVDLKTGNPITKREAIEAHPQLRAYQLAYAEGVLDEFLEELGEHSAGGAKLLWVKKGLRKKLYRESVQPVLNEEELEGFRGRIRQAAAGMAAAEFRGVLEIDEWAHGRRNSLGLHRVKAVSSD